MYVCMCMSDLCKLFRYFQKVRDCDTEKERERERKRERQTYAVRCVCVCFPFAMPHSL